MITFFCSWLLREAIFPGGGLKKGKLQVRAFHVSRWRCRWRCFLSLCSALSGFQKLSLIPPFLVAFCCHPWAPCEVRLWPQHQCCSCQHHCGVVWTAPLVLGSPGCPLQYWTLLSMSWKIAKDWGTYLLIIFYGQLLWRSSSLGLLWALPGHLGRGLLCCSSFGSLEAALASAAVGMLIEP